MEAEPRTQRQAAAVEQPKALEPRGGMEGAGRESFIVGEEFPSKGFPRES